MALVIRGALRQLARRVVVSVLCEVLDEVTAIHAGAYPPCACAAATGEDPIWRCAACGLINGVGLRRYTPAVGELRAAARRVRERAS